jgi:hypothetical protein
MKKLLLLLTIPVLLFSCSKEESMDSVEKETKTITPAVGYESPYDLNSINPYFPIVFINNSPYSVSYRLATIAGFFDGNWNGIIDYTSVGGPVLTPGSAPILLGGGSPDEFAMEPWAHSISSPAGSSVTININSLSFSGKPYNPTEINFLKKYSKLLHVHVSGIGPNLMLKHDVPLPFTNMNGIPAIMVSNGYNVISGVPAHNYVMNQPMGISVFHNYFREIIWPDMPNYQSEYYLSYSGTPLHLYFKTFANHIEIVLE